MNPKNLKMCNVSKFADITLSKFGSCFLDQFIELARLKIRGNLLIPTLVFKLVEPLTQRSKILGRQITNAGFKGFNFVYKNTYLVIIGLS